MPPPFDAAGRSLLEVPRFPAPAGRLALLLALVLLAMTAAACGSGSGGGDGDLTATGVVVDVQGSISEVEQFDLALADGSRITIVPEGGVLERAGFSPAHLREHMALAQPVSVTYRVDDGRNVMTGLGDA